MVDSSVLAEPRTAPVAAVRPTRVVAIDILRGLAILWVMSFHLWEDMTYHVDNVEVFPRLRDHVLRGEFLAAVPRLGELILSQGYLGVPLFMILSGISLSLNAYRRGEPPALTGYITRFRRVLPVYWAGVMLFLATIAVIALLQSKLDGGSFAHQWSNVRIAALSPVHVTWADVPWALSVFGWLFRNKGGTVPVGSLWFVVILLPYYLLFPFALRLERRVGPWRLAAGAVAFTLIVRAAYIPWANNVFDGLHANRYLWALAPFRVSEFLIGMSIGHLLADRREQLGAWIRSPIDTTGVVLLGLTVGATGLLLAPRGDAGLIFSDVLVQIGLALIIVPLLFKIPGRLETSLVARALVFLGVVSFTALIVDDMMRYVASFLRYEGVTGPAWWFFLVVVYVPVGTLLAYPLAWLFRLLPSQRAASPRQEATVETSPSAAPRARRHSRASRRRAARASRV